MHEYKRWRSCQDLGITMEGAATAIAESVGWG